MKTNLTRLLSAFVMASAPLAGTATLFANIYADTYSCRPVNAHTTLQGSVRLITSPSYSLRSFAISGLELGQIKISEGPIGIEALGRDMYIADATLDYKIIVPKVVLNEHRDSQQVFGMIIRSLAGTLPPPNHTQLGPVQLLDFEPLNCNASAP